MTNPSTAKDQVEIPFGAVEYTAFFEKAALKAWENPTGLIEQMLSVIEPYGFAVDGVELKSKPEKIIDWSLLFRRTAAGHTITLSPTKLLIAVENANWEEADKIVEAVTVTRNAALKASGSQLKVQHIHLAMHVQPKTKPRMEITAPLFTTLSTSLMSGELQ